MSTDYTHFSQLAFDRLFARGEAGAETLVINSSGIFVGPVSVTGALSVKSITTSSAATFAGTLKLSALGTGVAHVSSTGIVSSSTIVNADVSAAAAIDGSKITSASTSASGVLTASSQTIAGAKTLAGNFLPEATGTRNLGSTSLHWNQIWGDSLRMGGSQIGSTNERISAQNSITAATSVDNRLSYLRAINTGDTAITGGALKAMVLNARRTITTNTTDTSGQFCPLEVQFEVATGGAVYTNSNTAIGNGGMVFEPMSVSGGGSVAFSRFAHALFKTDSINTGTRKSYINFGAISGATNNAFISDNDAFTGNYFINSTSTNTSLFSGVVNCSAGVRTEYATTNTANPPTQAEMVTAFGSAATNGSGFLGVLNDNGGGTNEYLVFGDGTNYFYIAGTVGA